MLSSDLMSEALSAADEDALRTALEDPVPLLGIELLADGGADRAAVTGMLLRLACERVSIEMPADILIALADPADDAPVLCRGWIESVDGDGVMLQREVFTEAVDMLAGVQDSLMPDALRQHLVTLSVTTLSDATRAMLAPAMLTDEARALLSDHLPGTRTGSGYVVVPSSVIARRGVLDAVANALGTPVALSLTEAGGDALREVGLRRVDDAFLRGCFHDQIVEHFWR